jgi:hypothetical protein
LGAGDLDTVVDERSSDATTPDVRVNEQGVQLDISVWPGQQGSETNDLAVSFRDEDRTCGDLIYRQFDRIGVGEQGFTIAGIGEGRT